MKKILGLDIGTNSIGWSLINQAENENEVSHIIKLGSRIVPMDGEESNFKRGEPQTRNAKKREKKGARVGNKRYKLRRNKLIYVLQKLDMLPDQIKLNKSFDNALKIQKVNVLPIKEGTFQLTDNEFLQLRVKAIHEPISKKEFGRVLYRFNQLRGYAGGDHEDLKEDLDEVLGLTSTKKIPTQISTINNYYIVKLLKTDEIKGKKKKVVYEITVKNENGEILTGSTIVDGLKQHETVELQQKIRQNSKTGVVSSREFSVPNKTGWRKKMENIEDALEKHALSKGRKTYISEYLLDLSNEVETKKIRDNVILRSRYQEEFDAIWQKQSESLIKDVPKETIIEIANFLFPGKSITQIKLRNEAIKKGLYHIIYNQIIYFQRPLKDQSHLISSCRFEDGEKAVPKSHPLFQEFKIWEQINKLSLNQREQIGVRRNGKPKFRFKERTISTQFKEYLYLELQVKQKISFGAVFKKLKETEQFHEGKTFFNGLSTKGELRGNDTKILLKKRLGQYWNFLHLDDINNLIALWSILYNGKGNEYDINSDRNKKLSSFLITMGINESREFEKVVIAISSIKFKRDYASISLTAVNKALMLVRAGEYYNLNKLDEEVYQKISKILNENVTDNFEKALQRYLENNESQILNEGGFINAYALMLLYGKHTAKEISSSDVFSSYSEITPLKRHSLRNPLVEQMINETLMICKDVWREFGQISVIKVELARELKNSKKQREKIHQANKDGRIANQKIRQRLSELKYELSSSNVERYKLWSRQPNRNPEYLATYESTKSEENKLKLWEEQGHVDPYTGKPIPLSHLFNKGLYDIDHIIPQSRYFDDSLANKVVCARKVNKDKGNRTSMEYFENGSTECEILSKEIFMDNAVNKFFGKKRNMMLATSIPNNPIDRKKKDTQYIAVRVREELAKIVGSENVKTTTGGVTHYLRNHWGVTKIFKGLLKNRFEDYYRKKAEKEFDQLQKKGESVVVFLIDLATRNLNQDSSNQIINKMLTYDEINLELFTDFYIDCNLFMKGNNQIMLGYSKRYDHRHHAMDALITACTNPEAVKRLNELNKHLSDWLKKNINKYNVDLNVSNEDLLENFLQLEPGVKDVVLKDVKNFRKVEIPWVGFHKDVEKALSETVVSIKPKDKILIQKKEEKDDKGVLYKTKEKIIRIRGPLHEETIYGLSSGYETVRVSLQKFASQNFDTVGNLKKIVNNDVRRILTNHFEVLHNKSKSEAFGAEGLLGLKKTLSSIGHPEIKSIKVYRKKPVKNYKISLQKLEREKSYNQSLYVKTGSNYLFAVMAKDNGNREYDILSLFDAVSLIKDAFVEEPDKSKFSKDDVLKCYFEQKNKSKLMFSLKHLDMVYLPDEGEEIVIDETSPLFTPFWNSPERVKNIFSVTKFTGKEIYFNHHTTAEVIEKQVELGSQNMLQTLNGRKIIQYCIPITLDRLGNIIKVM